MQERIDYIYLFIAIVGWKSTNYCKYNYRDTLHGIAGLKIFSLNINHLVLREVLNLSVVAIQTC